MDKLLNYLKSNSVHTPRLAIARLLLALGMLLTIASNDMGIIANHSYTQLPDYSARHTVTKSVPFKQLDLFMVMPPHVAKGVAMVILLLVMTGLAPQITSVLHFIVCFSFHNYFLVVNGGDEATFVLSLLLIPLCITDPRWNQWQRKTIAPSQRNIVANIGLLVIQVQIAYIYANAGWAKFSSQVWREGTAVYYYTSHYRMGAPTWLQHIEGYVTLTPFVKVVTWGIIGFELLLGICLFLPARFRNKLFVPALVFHLLLAINFGLVSFFFAMAGMLTLYFSGKRLTSQSSLR